MDLSRLAILVTAVDRVPRAILVIAAGLGAITLPAAIHTVGITHRLLVQTRTIRLNAVITVIQKMTRIAQITTIVMWVIREQRAVVSTATVRFDCAL